MIRDHRKAVEAFLVDPLTYYVTKAPATVPTRYAVLHFAPGMSESTSYDEDTSSDWRDWTFVTHAIGADAEQAGWVQDRLESMLLGQRPTVAGRACTRIRRVGSGIPPDTDNDVQPPVVLARDSWVFSSIANQ